MHLQTPAPLNADAPLLLPQGYRFDGDNLDFATRQEVAEERRKLRLMQLRQVAWEAEEAACVAALPLPKRVSDM